MLNAQRKSPGAGAQGLRLIGGSAGAQLIAAALLAACLGCGGWRRAHPSCRDPRTELDCRGEVCDGPRRSPPQLALQPGSGCIKGLPSGTAPGLAATCSRIRAGRMSGRWSANCPPAWSALAWCPTSAPLTSRFGACAYSLHINLEWQSERILGIHRSVLFSIWSWILEVNSRETTARSRNRSRCACRMLVKDARIAASRNLVRYYRQSHNP